MPTPTTLHHLALAPPRQATDLAFDARSALAPYLHHLMAAKSAAQRKGDLGRVPWTDADVGVQLTLEPLDTILAVETQPPCYAVRDWQGPAPDPAAPLFDVITSVLHQPDAVDCTDGTLTVSLSDADLDGHAVVWCQQTVHLSHRPSPPLACDRPLRHVGPDAVVVAGTGPPALTRGGVPVVAAPRPASHGATTLGTEPWDGKLGCRMPELPATPELVADNHVRFRWREASGKGRGHRVRLEEGRLAADATIDPRLLFFEDSVREVWVLDRQDRRTGKLKVIGRERRELVLRLAERPPPGTRLGMPINITAFKRQLAALHDLRDRPHPTHRHLIRLLVHPERAWWPPVTPTPVDTWHLLTDPAVEGTADQRDFVQTALATPDFAFLEGPPGSGKTHAICELVLQLIARGLRVLLCSNTHVAVDNVLERLVGHYPQVVGVRLGHLDRVDPHVQDCQLDRQVEGLGGALGLSGRAGARLVLSAANLVCGTTNGFLSHPAFGDRTSDPPFDVLILDEASKTTLQEFLVPALWARRHVIVGDVRQLPPFSSADDLQASLEGLADRDHRLEGAHQRALALVHALDQSATRRWRWRVVEQRPVVAALRQELTARGVGDRVVAWPEDTDLERLAADLVVLETGDAEERCAGLSPDVLPLAPTGPQQVDPRQERWLVDEPCLRRPTRVFGADCRHPADVRDAAGSVRSWSQELGWRLVREHALQAARGDKGRRVAASVRSLLPAAPGAEWAEDAVRALQEVGLRSVIEALRVGRTRRGRRSALTEALPGPAWQARSVLLTWQHRMHPELSALPREVFYEDRALRDASTVFGRPWSFADGLPSRRCWVDVRGRVERGVNQAEADAVGRILARWDRGVSAQVAVLAFHVAQERALRKVLRGLCGQPGAVSRFQLGAARLQLATVDRFQGREADLVILSLRNSGTTGHADSPGRLNVSLTRARHQLLVVGDQRYFGRCPSPELQALSCQTPTAPTSWWRGRPR